MWNASSGKARPRPRYWACKATTSTTAASTSWTCATCNGPMATTRPGCACRPVRPWPSRPSCRATCRRRPWLRTTRPPRPRPPNLHRWPCRPRHRSTAPWPPPLRNWASSSRLMPSPGRCPRRRPPLPPYRNPPRPMARTARPGSARKPPPCPNPCMRTSRPASGPGSPSRCRPRAPSSARSTSPPSGPRDRAPASAANCRPGRMAKQLIQPRHPPRNRHRTRHQARPSPLPPGS